MRKFISILLVLVLVMSLASCKKETIEDKLDKVEDLIDDEEFDDAIDLIDEILDEDETLLEAWDLLVEASLEAGEFGDADEALEKYFEFVQDNVDDIDPEDAVDSITKFAEDIMDEGEELGKWFSEFMPELPDLSEFNYQMVVGDVLELDVPKGLTAYYTTDGSDPIKDGEEYDEDDGIEFGDASEYYLSVVYVNALEIYGEVASTFINVVDEVMVDPDDVTDGGDGGNTDGGNDGNTDGGQDVPEPEGLVAVEVDLAPGTYDGPLEIRITNYPEDTEYWIQYTYDGQDPTIEYAESYWDSIDLIAGDYTLGIVVYDFDTDTYSDVVYLDYTVKNPDAIKIGFFDIDMSTFTSFRRTFNSLAWYDIYVDPIFYESVDDINPLDIPDALISWGSYVEDLEPFGILADVSNIVNLDNYEYYGNALNAGTYNGTTYQLPLLIRPQYLMYGQYGEEAPETYEGLAGEADWSDHKFLYGADSPELLLGIYYGLGGEPLDIQTGNIQFDRKILVEAIQLVIDMPSNGIGDRLYTSDIIFDEIDNYNVSMTLVPNFGDTVYEYNVSPIGQMPLPNGQQARFYNQVIGLMVSKTALLDSGKLNSIIELYDALAEDDYTLNSFGWELETLPAFYHQAMTGNAGTDIEPYQYVDIINAGITECLTYNLYNMYAAMEAPMAQILTGASAESIADAIINAVQ